MIKIAYVYRCLGKFSYKICVYKKNIHVSTRNPQYLLEESSYLYVKSPCLYKKSLYGSPSLKKNHTKINSNK